MNNLQNQLLQVLTNGEISLLLENETVNTVNMQVSQFSSPQTEYSEFIEQSPVQSFNSPQQHSPQPINYRNPQFRS